MLQTIPYNATHDHTRPHKASHAICQLTTIMCHKGKPLCCLKSYLNVSVLFVTFFCSLCKIFCSIWSPLIANIFCSFQNDSTPTRTRTKLLLGSLSFARGQKSWSVRTIPILSMYALTELTTFQLTKSPPKINFALL